MRKYWIMKTFLSGDNHGFGSDTFKRDSIIGIDQDIIDKCYTGFSELQLEDILKTSKDNNYNYTEEIDRFFKQFYEWMNIGDLIIVGVGQKTKFETSFICKVIGDCEFDSKKKP